MRLLLLLALLTSTLGARFEIFPVSRDQHLLSPDYQLALLAGGQTHPIPVLLSQARTEGPGTNRVKDRTIAWAQLTTDAPVELELTLPADSRIQPIGAPKIWPSRFNLSIATSSTPNSFRFLIPRPGQYVIDFGGENYRHGFVLFVDPPEKNLPDPAAPHVANLSNVNAAALEKILADKTKTTLAFAPGVHRLDTKITLPRHIRRIHLAGGAIVYGAFFSDHPDLAYTGRGILSGRFMAHRDAHQIEATRSAKNTTVEGITIADYSMYAIRTLGTHCDITNVKTIGAWLYNNDSLVSWGDATISHCFLHSNDDAIKLYGSNITVHDIVAWQKQNGAIFQLGWSSLEGQNIRVRDIDIVRAEWAINNTGGISPNNSILNLRLSYEGEGNTQSDFLFENIRTETPVARGFDLRMRDKKPGERAFVHTLKNFTFRNWDIQMVTDPAQKPGNFLLPARPDSYQNLRFENLRINGTVITTENAATAGLFETAPEARPAISFSP